MPVRPPRVTPCCSLPDGPQGGPHPGRSALPRPAQHCERDCAGPAKRTLHRWVPSGASRHRLGHRPCKGARQRCHQVPVSGSMASSPEDTVHCIVRCKQSRAFVLCRAVVLCTLARAYQVAFKPMIACSHGTHCCRVRRGPAARLLCAAHLSLPRPPESEAGLPGEAVSLLYVLTTVVGCGTAQLQPCRHPKCRASEAV